MSEKKSIDTWFNEYGESHQNSTNKLLHWICIPLIMFSTLGLLWALGKSLNQLLGLPPWGNIALLVIVLSLIWYMRRSIALTIGMTLLTAVMVAAILYVEQSAPIPLWQFSLAVFAVSWVGQFIGHKIEGKKPSFFKDLQFLLIGPAWLLGFIYRRLSISY